MSVRVNALGEFTSELAEVYLDYASGAGGREGEVNRLVTAFRRLQLNVSLNQIGQILSCVQECRSLTNRPQPSPALTWPEFCVCTVELHSVAVTSSHQQRWCKQLGEPRVSGSSTSIQKSKSRERRGCTYEVFLGGSCNPTTWRKDVAIPILESNGITFYNPHGIYPVSAQDAIRARVEQVEEWSPELIEIEEQAKQAADTLLFVVDNQTRAVSSMVEIAYFAGAGRNMVLVVNDIVGENARIGLDLLSPREVADLNRGRIFVRMLAREAGSVIQSSIEKAVHTAITVLRSPEYPSLVSPHAHSHQLGDQLKLLQRVYYMHETASGTEHLSIEETVSALRSLGIDRSFLTTLLDDERTVSHDHLPSWRQHGLSFDDFCTLFSEVRLQNLHRETGQWRRWRGLTVFVSLVIRWMSGWLWSPARPSIPIYLKDVFLGGSCGTTTWRADMAIPILRQYGVSYFNPQVTTWNAQLLPLEQAAKERSTVILQVISRETLSVASMVEISYHIGQGRRVVLCLNDISKSSALNKRGIYLSDKGIRDYNRGRAYLASIAKCHCIPTYTDVTDAVLAAVYLVRGYALPPPTSLPLRGTSV